VTDVLATSDPQLVIERAGDSLARDPVRNNVLLTLLHARVAEPQPGRYWVVGAGDPLGVVFQSPLSFSALVSSMSSEHVSAVVNVIAKARIRLPGINGEATTAARFAGTWTEATRSSAVPVQGQRLYEVREISTPTEAPGAFRAATPEDFEVLVEWTQSFMAEIGEQDNGDTAATVAHRLALGHYWLWDDGGAVSMAALSEPTAGVVRVQAVYTPEPLRGHGYASGCVAALSRRALDEQHRCILFTDLANATSNSIYRSIGYRAVSEVLRYRFD
jgi:predicted GNAT family acetyltransferase